MIAVSVAAVPLGGLAPDASTTATRSSVDLGGRFTAGARGSGRRTWGRRPPRPRPPHPPLADAGRTAKMTRVDLSMLLDDQRLTGHIPLRRALMAPRDALLVAHDDLADAEAAVRQACQRWGGAA